MASGALAVQPAGRAFISQIFAMSEDADPTALLSPCASAQVLTNLVGDPLPAHTYPVYPIYLPTLSCKDAW